MNTHFQFCSGIALCLFAVSLISAEEVSRRYEYQHSFKSPFFLTKNTELPFWNYGGSAVLSEEVVRLTPASQNRAGWIWNTRALKRRNWEIEMEFRVGGGGRLGADGLAIWLTEYPPSNWEDHSIYGGQDHWTGLGILLDTYDNDNQRDNPKVIAIWNDGTQSFNTEVDGEGNAELGHCQSMYRNPYRNSKLKVRYVGGKLEVLVDALFTGNYARCIGPVEVNIPSGYRLGLSARTGMIFDFHDIYSFVLNSFDGEEDSWDEPSDRNAPPTQPGDDDDERAAQRANNGGASNNDGIPKAFSRSNREANQEQEDTGERSTEFERRARELEVQRRRREEMELAELRRGKEDQGYRNKKRRTKQRINKRDAYEGDDRTENSESGTVGGSASDVKEELQNILNSLAQLSRKVKENHESTRRDIASLRTLLKAGDIQISHDNIRHAVSNALDDHKTVQEIRDAVSNVDASQSKNYELQNSLQHLQRSVEELKGQQNEQNQHMPNALNELRTHVREVKDDLRNSVEASKNQVEHMSKIRQEVTQEAFFAVAFVIWKRYDSDSKKKTF